MNNNNNLINYLNKIFYNFIKKIKFNKNLPIKIYY